MPATAVPACGRPIWCPERTPPELFDPENQARGSCRIQVEIEEEWVLLYNEANMSKYSAEEYATRKDRAHETQKAWRERNPGYSANYLKQQTPEQRAKRLATARANYLLHREERIPRGVKRVRDRRLHCFALGGGKCVDCGESNPAVLRFHHRDPSTKLFEVAARWTTTLEVLEAEVAKCDLLCSNCHLIRHAAP